MKSVLAAGVLAVLTLSSNAFAHSDYWRCAAIGGSYEDVARRCGYRSDFDRTGRVGPDRGYGRGGWDRGYGRGGWDRGRHGGRWHLNSTEASVGTCYAQAEGQGEAMANITAEACEAMGGQSFTPVEQ